MQSFTDQVRDWAVKQPADGEYDYSRGVPNEDGVGCALCQFLVAAGYTDKPYVGGDYWHDDGPDHPLDRRLASALSGLPHTFGGLAERLGA